MNVCLESREPRYWVMFPLSKRMKKLNFYRRDCTLHLYSMPDTWLDSLLSLTAHSHVFPLLNKRSMRVWSLTFFSVWIISAFLHHSTVFTDCHTLSYHVLTSTLTRAQTCQAPCSSHSIEMPPLQTLSLTTKGAGAYVCLHNPLSSELLFPSQTYYVSQLSTFGVTNS